MEENGKIYGAILGVMADVGVIGKDSVNKQQGFKYRGVDDVMNALQPAMIKNGVMVVPEVLEHSREERVTGKGGILLYSVCRIRFRFYAEDGSFIDAVTIGEGMDSGDKATNKAMSAAFKYACFQTFCIPTDEMKDPDADTPEPVPKKGRITSPMVNSLFTQLKRTGIGINGLLRKYGVSDIHDLTVDQYKDAMDRLQNAPDKVMPPSAPEESIPDDIPDEYCGLPFN